MGIAKVFHKALYNYDTQVESDACSVKDFGPSMTVQSQVEDVDMNVIMARFGVTQKMPEGFATPMYGDFEEVIDFRTANERVIAARQAFESMPWQLKDRFAHDPQRLLAFVADDANMDEALKLGLLSKERFDERRARENVGGESQAPGGGVGLQSAPARAGAADAPATGAAGGAPKGGPPAGIAPGST